MNLTDLWKKKKNSQNKRDKLGKICEKKQEICFSKSWKMSLICEKVVGPTNSFKKQKNVKTEIINSRNEKYLGKIRGKKSMKSWKNCKINSWKQWRISESCEEKERIRKQSAESIWVGGKVMKLKKGNGVVKMKRCEAIN